MKRVLWSEKAVRKAEDIPQDRILLATVSVFVARCCFITHRIPDTIDVECRVDYQRGVENVAPEVASIRNFNRISREREEPLRWVRHVGRDIVRVIAGGSSLIEVLKIGLASEVEREFERETNMREESEIRRSYLKENRP